MQLHERAFRHLVRLVHYHSGRIMDVNVNQAATPAQMQQGTRAFVSQGTMADIGGYDRPNWTPPITQFSPGGPEIANAAGNSTVHPWPANPARWEENPAGSREAIMITDGGLQAGAAPGRILRQMYERVQGANGGQQTGTNIGTPEMPWLGSWQFMPHMKVPRQALGTKGPQKLADDNAPIPGIFAGNPRP